MPKTVYLRIGYCQTLRFYLHIIPIVTEKSPCHPDIRLVVRHCRHINYSIADVDIRKYKLRIGGIRNRTAHCVGSILCSSIIITDVGKHPPYSCLRVVIIVLCKFTIRGQMSSDCCTCHCNIRVCRYSSSCLKIPNNTACHLIHTNIADIRCNVAVGYRQFSVTQIILSQQTTVIIHAIRRNIGISLQLQVTCNIIKGNISLCKGCNSAYILHIINVSRQFQIREGNITYLREQSPITLFGSNTKFNLRHRSVRTGCSRHGSGKNIVCAVIPAKGIDSGLRKIQIRCNQIICLQ